jgi:hypothetical protein
MQKLVRIEEGKIIALTSECKTLSCVSRVKVAKQDGKSMYELINVIKLGAWQSPTLEVDDDPAYALVTFYTLYHAYMREESAYAAAMDEGFEVTIEAALLWQKERLEEEARNAAGLRQVRRGFRNGGSDGLADRPQGVHTNASHSRCCQRWCCQKRSGRKRRIHKSDQGGRPGFTISYRSCRGQQRRQT